MKFSEELWKAAACTINAIHDHPFNQELADGSLALAKFQFYLKQDSLYLIDFARALAIAGARSPHVDDIHTFLQFAQGAIVAERQLHQHYFDLYGITTDTSQAPGCFAYTSFLLSSASLKEHSEAVAALLPCFWIYREVGYHLHAKSSANNPYQKWIDTYAGNEFNEVVTRIITITDRLANDASPAQKKAMKEAFLLSCRLEWLFWDSAYRIEKWEPH